MQNNQAKNEIFASIRQNLATSAPFDAVHAEHRMPQQNAESLAREKSFVENAPIVSTVLPAPDLIESFRENLSSIGGNCQVVENKTEAAAEIKKIIDKLNAKKIAVSNSPVIIQIKNSFQTDALILENASAGELFDCDLGITGAQYGIAETGTLVLESEREFNRLASLVPPVHVCILESKNIRRGLGEVLEILEKDLSRAVTFITGPSRTSDIELTLAIGVHGPAELYVVLIEEK